MSKEVAYPLPAVSSLCLAWLPGPDMGAAWPQFRRHTSAATYRHRKGGLCPWRYLQVREEHSSQETPHVALHALPNQLLTRRRVGLSFLTDQSSSVGHCRQRGGCLFIRWSITCVAGHLAVLDPAHDKSIALPPQSLDQTGAPMRPAEASGTALHNHWLILY